MQWASDQGQEARPGTGQSTRRRRCSSGGPRSPSEKAARGGLLWWSAQPRGHRPRGQGGERPAPPCLHLPASHGGFPPTERAKAACAVGQGKAARRVSGAGRGQGPDLQEQGPRTHTKHTLFQPCRPESPSRPTGQDAGRGFSKRASLLEETPQTQSSRLSPLKFATQMQTCYSRQCQDIRGARRAPTQGRDVNIRVKRQIWVYTLKRQSSRRVKIQANIRYQGTMHSIPLRTLLTKSAFPGRRAPYSGV